MPESNRTPTDYQYIVGGKAGRADGFTHTNQNVDDLEIQDELSQDDPAFILRNIDLASACCGEAPAIAEGYLRRKEVQRLVCSQSLFVAGFLPRLLEHVQQHNREANKMAFSGRLIGIVGAGGQLGSAIVQTLLDNGWEPFRLAVSGRGYEKLSRYEALGIGVFEDVSMLIRVAQLVIVATGPQHARQVSSSLGDAGMSSCLVLSTLAGISEGNLRRVLGAPYLLQARIDMATLDVTETMGYGSTKSTPAIRNPNTLKRPYSGASSRANIRSPGRPASDDEVSHGGRTEMRAVHQRAARQLFRSDQEARRFFSTLESFFLAQGLDATQAYQASQDWCPFTDGPSLGSSNSPEREGQAQSSTGLALSRRGGCTSDESTPNLRMSQQQTQVEPVIARSPGTPVRLTSRGRTVESSMSNSSDYRGVEDLRAPPGKRAATAIDVAPEGDQERNRKLTMTSLQSALPSTRSRSPRRPPPTGRSQTQEFEPIRGERWVPLLKWPPEDIAKVEDVYAEFLYGPYSDAVRESGYWDSSAQEF